MIQHHRAAQHDHHGHGKTGQGVDNRHQNLRHFGGPKLVRKIGLHLVAVEAGVHLFAAQALHGSDGMDAFGQRAIHRGISFMRLDERGACQGQPEDAHHEQDRQNRQRDRAQPRIEIQHQPDDPEQEDDIADRDDRGFQKFLHRADVAL